MHGGKQKSSPLPFIRGGLGWGNNPHHNLPNNLFKQMTNTPNQYEYSYQNSQAGHHHGYLLKPLMEMMSEMLPPPHINKNLEF